MLCQLMNDETQPRELNILAVEILEHFTRLRECRVEILHHRQEILIGLTTRVPECASSMLLTLSHLLWDMEWFELFENNSTKGTKWRMALETFVVQWSCRAIHAMTSHELARKRMWRIELHERIELSATNQNEDHIPAFWSVLLKRVLLLQTNYMGTSMKIGTELDVVKRWKTCGLLSLGGCLYTSENFDIRRTTGHTFMYTGDTFIADIGSDIAGLFSGWLIYEGYSAHEMEYNKAKVSLEQGNSKIAYQSNLVRGEVLNMMQRTKILRKFATLQEWKTLLNASFGSSPLTPPSVTFSQYLAVLERNFSGGAPLNQTYRIKEELVKQYATAASNGQSTMHRKCSNSGCTNIERKVKEFSCCGRCKFTIYCSGNCLKTLVVSWIVFFFQNKNILHTLHLYMYTI